MEGQIDSNEFEKVLSRASEYKFPTLNSAIVRHGKTVNYWIRHKDNSWENYHCKTL